MVNAHVVRLAKRPVGLPADTDFAIVAQNIPSPEDGGFVVETLFVSVDPAMRTWISGEDTYRDPVNPGDAIPALAIGRVIQSRHTRFPIGAVVRGPFGVASHAMSAGAGVTLIPDGPAEMIPHHLGVLGISGLSGWFGLTEIGQVRAGDTVLISGAAGAVGSAAGQVAQIAGARVVGVAGGEEKCAWARETFGFDAMIDHRAPDFAAQIGAALPTGADIVFDNVGGRFLDTALANLAPRARIVICGGISQYNSAARQGPANYLSLVVKRASMAGFLVHDFADRFPDALRRLSAWHAQGRLIGAVDVIAGLEAFPRALAGLFEGINRGKLLLAPNAKDGTR